MINSFISARVTYPFVITILLLLFTAVLTSAQEPNLHLEGSVSTNVEFDDGFEDATLPPFTSSGNATWSVQSLESFEGTYSARSGLIGDLQQTHLDLDLNINKPTKLTFAVKVSSELGSDELTFKINNDTKLILSGDEPWNTHTFFLESGMNSLRWTYEKSNMNISGDDAAWIDQVKVVSMDGHTIQIQDGTEGIGKVLVSDSEGKAKWASTEMLLGTYSLPVDLQGNLSLIPLLLSGERTGAPLLLRNSAALGAGIYIDSTWLGALIDSTSAGILIRNPKIVAVQIDDSQGDGILVADPQRNGVNIINSKAIGLRISGTDSTAVYIDHFASDYQNNKWAAYFNGDLYADFMSKGAGTFFIDHPIDPENKYLSHSFVESPDMMNVYNGNAALNENGEAVVVMPDYFDALNRDFRYQLTPIGGAAVLYIAEELQKGRFKIAGGQPGMKVSWQVTGIRQDPFANQNRIQVEADKPPHLKGKYLHPDAWAEEKGLDRLPAINPEQKQNVDRNNAGIDLNKATEQK